MNLWIKGACSDRQPHPPIFFFKHMEILVPDLYGVLCGHVFWWERDKACGHVMFLLFYHLIPTSLVSKWRRHPPASHDMLLISLIWNISVDIVLLQVSRNFFCGVFHSAITSKSIMLYRSFCQNYRIPGIIMLISDRKSYIISAKCVKMASKFWDIPFW